MQDSHLAIASVPMQQWGALYDEKEALRIGTIFQDLNKPFFASEISEIKTNEALPKTEEQRNREDLMCKIMEVSFVLDDLTLYLDTHAEDSQAFQMYRQMAEKRNELKQKFAAEFYPLTRDCIVYCEKEEPFCWQEGPMPWEGACV